MQKERPLMDIIVYVGIDVQRPKHSSSYDNVIKLSF